jgi:hypothetical protein
MNATAPVERGPAAARPVLWVAGLPEAEVDPDLVGDAAPVPDRPGVFEADADATVDADAEAFGALTTASV